jgi:KDO2-lipid IV(A) lauroyltransferase
MTPKSPATLWLEHLTLRVLMVVLLALPWGAARGLARAVGFMAGYAMRGRRRDGLANIQQALGVSPREAARILNASYAAVGESIAESIWLARTVRRSDPYATASVTIDPAVEAFRQDDGTYRGFIMVSAHLGNWELIGSLRGVLKFPALAVVRAFDNPLVEAELNRVRASFYEPYTPKHGALAALVKQLKRGGSLMMLVDQNAGRRGRFVPFFGRPA